VPLIRECVDALVEWHRKHKSSSAWPDDLDGPALVRILAPLALQSFQDGSGLIKQDSLQKLGEKEERRKFHQQLVAARFVEQRNGSYVFPLETFREYFAARAVAASADPFAVVKGSLHRPEWERVVLYTAGCLDRGRASHLDLALPRLTWLVVKGIGPLLRIATSFLGLAALRKPLEDATKEAAKELGPILQGPLERWLAASRRSTEFFLTAIWRSHCRWRWHAYERILGRDLRLAVRCVGGVAGCPQKLANRLVSLLMERFPTMLHASAFTAALQEAASSTQVQEHLLDLARDKAGDVGWTSAEMTRLFAATTALRQVASEPRVKQRLLELTRNRWVCSAATHALAPTASDPEVQLRLRELTQDNDWLVREAAVKALGQVAFEPGVQAWLLELARAKDDPALRLAATKALGQETSEPGVQERLQQLTEDHEIIAGLRAETIVAWEAKRALKQAAGENVVLPFDKWVREISTKANSDRNMQDRILQLLSDENTWTTLGVMKDLGPAALVPRVQDRLLELMRWKAPKPHVEPGSPLHSIPFPIVDEQSMREAAAEAVKQVGFVPGVQGRLLELARDQDKGVRRAAALALQGWRGPVTRPTLRRLARLAKKEPAAVEALEVLVQAWEEQKASLR
jgi:HEAT repeat protein